MTRVFPLLFATIALAACETAQPDDDLNEPPAPPATQIVTPSLDGTTTPPSAAAEGSPMFNRRSLSPELLSYQPPGVALATISLPVAVTSMPAVLIAGTPQVQVVSMPSVQIAGTPSVQVVSMPSVQIAGTPSVQVVSMPSVQIAGTPSVQVVSMPKVEIAGMPQVQVVSMPKVETILPETHLGRSSSEMIELRQIASGNTLTYNASLSDDDLTPWVVPAGKVLVITDVQFSSNGSSTSGPSNVFSIVEATAVGQRGRWTSYGPTDSAGLSHATEHFTGGITIQSGHSVRLTGTFNGSSFALGYLTSSP
jgi:hypothetical protein